MTWDFIKTACEGMSANIPLESFDPLVLAKGTKVETKEHGEDANPDRIAADHIFEHGETESGEITSKYYEELDKMEKKLEKSSMIWDFIKKEAPQTAEKSGWDFKKEAAATPSPRERGMILAPTVAPVVEELWHDSPEMQEEKLLNYGRTMNPADVLEIRLNLGLPVQASISVDAEGISTLNRMAAELAEMALPVANEVPAEDVFKEVSAKIKTLASGSAKNVIKDTEKWATLTALYQNGKDLKDQALQDAILVLAEEAESAQSKAIEVELDRLTDESQKGNAKNIFISTFTSDVEKALPKKVEKAEQESKDAQELAGNGWEGLSREIPTEVEPIVSGESLDSPKV